MLENFALFMCTMSYSLFGLILAENTMDILERKFIKKSIRKPTRVIVYIVVFIFTFVWYAIWKW
jgi:hypothetical protein